MAAEGGWESGEAQNACPGSHTQAACLSFRCQQWEHPLYRPGITPVLCVCSEPHSCLSGSGLDPRMWCLANKDRVEPHSASVACFQKMEPRPCWSSVSRPEPRIF